jgi:enoyl-CoA hydratase
LAIFKQLGDNLDELEADQQVKLLILKGVMKLPYVATLESIEKLYRLPKPPIALIKTLAIGGGLELANSCNFRFATAGSKLGITASNIGII